MASPRSVGADWALHCSACDYAQAADRAAGVCPACGQPLLAESGGLDATAGADWSIWRYAGALPLRAGERPVSLGEGLTPLVEVPALAPEGGCALAALDQLAAAGRLAARDTIVLFNTGSGASYRHDDG